MLQAGNIQEQGSQSPIVILTTLEDTNTNNNGSKEATKAYITSEVITQVIEDLKIAYPKIYQDWREELSKQLQHAKAIETKNYSSSPYYNNNIVKPGNILIEQIIKEEKELKITYASAEKQAIYDRKFEFLRYVRYNEIAYYNGTYGNSPFYREEETKLQNLLRVLDTDVINQILGKLIRRYNIEKAPEIQNYQKFIHDHLQMLIFIKSAEEFKQERRKREQQLSHKKENQTRKQTNLETALQLRKSLENSRNSNNKNKQQHQKSEVITQKIGAATLPLTPKTIQQNKLENLKIKQLIKEYKILLQQNTKASYEEADRYLEEIFSRAERDESIITQHRTKLNRDTQEDEGELREKMEGLTRVNLELRQKAEDTIKENMEIKAKLSESLQLELRLDEKLLEEKQANKKLKESLRKWEDEAKIEQQKLKNLNEEIEKLQEQINKTKVTIKDKKNQTDNRTKTVHIQTEITNSDLEHKQALELQQITNKLQNIETLLIGQTNVKNNRSTGLAGVEECANSEQSRTSNSAILMKITSKELTIAQLKEILNERLLDEMDVPALYCRLARQRNTLILQSNSDENTEKLLKIIENFSDLKEKTEITYKLIKNRRIIITGIPSSVSTTTITKFIKEQTTITNTTIEKILQRPKSNNYHIILNMDSSDAQQLLTQKFLLIGLNTCHIRHYRPIIRCSNCQLYGHTSSTCRRDTICAKCSRGHHTNDCPFTLDSSQHRCTNCYLNDGYKKHTADSSSCPVFRSMLADRRRNC